ncbi:MAG: hypothetical protein RL220_1896 [Bacteroidota bacterium]|jgi:CBS domain-containing protein
MKTARQLIHPGIPVVNRQDDSLLVLNLMDEHKLAHLPVVENGKYLGLISDEELMESEHGHGHVATAAQLLEVSVLPDKHVLDILKVAGENKLSVIVVADHEANYLGSILLSDLVGYLSDYQSASQPGGIIVLEMKPGDYHLSQIARIVEENDAKILSMQVAPSGDDGNIELHLKISKEDVNAILQSLGRFGYTVKASYQEPLYTEDLKNRYDELMKYLNI